MSLEKLGPYRFKGVLGRGGMGTVYRGEHVESGDFHAVKVLAPNFSDDDHFRGRFESEINALLKLDHDNIVRLISYGQEDGMLFFSMELVEGNSLFQMQRKGHCFDWRQVLAIAKDVCLGLRHAHDRGIIHRDLKPGNLLMTHSPGNFAERGIPGVVKITDFGIAKSFGSSQNTGTNVLGTMDFMSPEQAKGEPVTFRSDLYSLGTVLFTLLSGKPPFSANSVEESIRNLTQVPPPHVTNVVPDVPQDLDRLIQQLMAKNPEKRVPTALALLHRIEEVEKTLRDNSEAKTAERSDLTIAEDTFELPSSSGGAGTTNRITGRPRSRSTRVSGRGSQPTAEYSDNDLSVIRRESIVKTGVVESPSVDRSHNYHNTVTDYVRQQHTVEDDLEERHQRGKIPLLLCLLAVLGLTAFGIYQALKPVSADQLFETIIASRERPDQVLKEIDAFLEIYPAEPRTLQISQLKGVGKAIRFYNSLSRKLAVRANLSGENRLTPVEQQFLDIVQLAEANSTTGNQKMAAFVTFHSSNADLNDRDKVCLEAARSFRSKIRADARIEVTKDIEQIRNAMQKAGAAEDPAESAAIYDSIVELYGNVMWGKEKEGIEGRKLVQRASQMFDVKLAEIRERLAESDESSQD